MEDERVRLTNMLELVQFKDKEVIFRQFDPAEECYLIDQVCRCRLSLCFFQQHVGGLRHRAE
jgi:hypothetical protein